MSKEFLTFSYKIPSEPSKNRVHIWRMIKELGAVYLQQGVALLPYNDELYTVLLDLREQVHSMKGKSTLGKLNFLNEEDENEIIAEFASQIDKEYIEFIENCRQLIKELQEEIKNEDFKFSEITENEEEYKKFLRWYDKIAKKDYFKSDNQIHALEILKEAQDRLQQYSDEVYRRDVDNI